MIQSSEDLTTGNWQTVASRIRGQNIWHTSSGFSVTVISPGVLDFADSTAGAGRRFYRFGVGEE